MPFVVNKYLKREQGERDRWENENTDVDNRKKKEIPQVFLKGPEALRFPLMACSVSPSETVCDTDSIYPN